MKTKNYDRLLTYPCISKAKCLLRKPLKGKRGIAIDITLTTIPIRYQNL